MKEILKPGREVSTVKGFECTRCGCIFQCDEDEYETGQQYNGINYSSVCPECEGYAREIAIG